MPQMSTIASNLRRRPRSTKDTLRSHPRNSLLSWSLGVRKYPALTLLAEKPSPGKVPHLAGPGPHSRAEMHLDSTRGFGRRLSSVLTKTGRRLTMVGGLCGYLLPRTPVPDTRRHRVIRGAPVPGTYGGSHCPPVRNRDNGAGDRSNWPGKPQTSSQARVMFVRAGYHSRMQLRRT